MRRSAIRDYCNTVLNFATLLRCRAGYALETLGTKRLRHDDDRTLLF